MTTGLAQHFRPHFRQARQAEQRQVDIELARQQGDGVTHACFGIDDALIEISGPEVPAMDGSAGPFTALLQSAGTQEQAETVHPLILTQPIYVSEGGSTIVALPSNRFLASVVLDYPRYGYLGTQAAFFDSASGEYAAQIAPARTFGFLSEIEALQAAGLGLGASYDNAVVLGETQYETSLRFSNELARHKLLDLIGDLALAGRPVWAEIHAFKPSHTLNTRLARLFSALFADTVF